MYVLQKFKAVFSMSETSLYKNVKIEQKRNGKGEGK